MAISKFNEIWPVGGNNYSLFSGDEEKLKRVMRWKGIDIFNEHFYPGGKFRGLQIVFSSRKYDRIATVFNLPLKKKSQGRVEQGKKMGRINKTLRK